MALLFVAGLLSLTGWISLYTVLCYHNGYRGYEWNCRLVTLLHGVLVICITAYIGYVDGPWPFAFPGTESTPLQIATLVMSLGYFVFDMGWCVYFRTEGAVMLLHHTMTILGILATLGLGESGIEGCAVLFGTEITNPLLQTRWFLRKTGRYETALGDAVDVVFVTLFVVMRVFVGGVMLYCELISPKPRFSVKCSGIAIYVLSWVFVVNIARFAMRKTRSRRDRYLKERHAAVPTLAVNGKEGKSD